MIGSFTMDTSRLQAFLGNSYRHIIRYTVAEALADSFVEMQTQVEPEKRLVSTGS